MRHGGRCPDAPRRQRGRRSECPDGRGESCVQADLVMVRPKGREGEDAEGQPEREIPPCSGEPADEIATQVRGPCPGRDGRALRERAVRRRRGRRDEGRRPLGVRGGERAHPTIMRATIGSRTCPRADPIESANSIAGHTRTTAGHPPACHWRRAALANPPVPPGPDTFPRLLQHAWCGRSIRPRVKRTWGSGRPGRGGRSPTRCARSRAASQRKDFGAGCTAIIGDNRPRLYWSMLARKRSGVRSRCIRTRRQSSCSC